MLKTSVQAGALRHVFGVARPLLKAVFTPLSPSCSPCDLCLCSHSLVHVFADVTRGSYHLPTNGDLLITVPGEAVKMGT